MILNIENDKFIEKITEFVQKEKVDFWNELSASEQKEIEIITVFDSRQNPDKLEKDIK